MVFLCDGGDTGFCGGACGDFLSWFEVVFGGGYVFLWIFLYEFVVNEVFKYLGGDYFYCILLRSNAEEKQSAVTRVFGRFDGYFGWVL